MVSVCRVIVLLAGLLQLAQARNVIGYGPESRNVKYRTPDESAVPLRPSWLQATPQANSIVVQWAPPDPEIVVRGYTLSYGQGIADVYQVQLDASTRDYTIENLEPASEYVISIKAFNSLGNGPSRYDTVVTGADLESAVPLRPSWLQATPLANSIVVQWASPDSEIVVRGYTLSYGQGIADEYQVQLDASTRDYTIENLEPASKYVISIRAFNSLGNGPSRYDTVITGADLDSTVPLRPSWLQATPQANSIVVQWALPDSEIVVRGYTLSYGQGIADVYQVQLDASAREYTIENLEPASEYVISIRAFNSLGNGPSRNDTVVTGADLALI